MIEILIIQILTFVGLALMLRWMFYQNVTAALRRMQFIQQENSKREQEITNRVSVVEADCQKKIREAEERAKKIFIEAKAKAEEARGEIIREARMEGQRVIQDSQDRREEIRYELEKEIDTKVTHLVSEAIRYALASKIEQRVHEQMVNDLLEEIKGLDSGRLHSEATEAQVITSQALTVPQRKDLTEILGQKLGTPIPVKESVDPKIIAGMIVQIGSLVLDGSLRNTLQEAIAHVRNGRPK